MLNTSACVALSDEEFAALLALDGGLLQKRPAPALEIRLRQLGLIEPSRLSRLPVRTAKGEALVRASKAPSPEEETERRAYLLPPHVIESVSA